MPTLVSWISKRGKLDKQALPISISRCWPTLQSGRRIPRVAFTAACSLALGVGLAFAQPSPPEFTALTGTPSSPYGRAAVATPDGRLFFIGGVDVQDQALSAVDVYDPYAHRYSASVYRLPTPRGAAAAAYVPTLGRILVAGGGTGDLDNERYLTSLDYFDPATGQTEPVRATLRRARVLHSMVWVPSQRKVLILGGMGANEEFVRETEWFDPASDTVSDGPTLLGSDGFQYFDES